MYQVCVFIHTNGGSGSDDKLLSMAINHTNQTIVINKFGS